jgi:hypothetical protein
MTTPPPMTAERAAMLADLDELIDLLESRQDIDDHGGPNEAMRMLATLAPIRGTLRAPAGEPVAWRCASFDLGGRVSETRYVTSRAEMLILQDKGFRCVELPVVSSPPSEACATCDGRGEIGGACGQTPESFEYRTEPCPTCSPSPAEQGAREDVGDMAGKASAWLDVVSLLRQLAPDFWKGGRTGRECALAAIRSLAAGRVGVANHADIADSLAHVRDAMGVAPRFWLTTINRAIDALAGPLVAGEVEAVAKVERLQRFTAAPINVNFKPSVEFWPDENGDWLRRSEVIAAIRPLVYADTAKGNGNGK